MRHDTCCVVNCKNNGKNSNHKFYKFPQASWKREQRLKWINAVKRKNPDGSPWYPKPGSRICSAHFIGGKKADEQNSPSYVPRIFPAGHTSTRVNENLTIPRYKLLVLRRIKKEKHIASIAEIGYKSNTFGIMENTLKIDKECQIDIVSNVENEGNTFICNRYIHSSKEVCDLEVQTEITSNLKIINYEQRKNKACMTIEKKIYADQGTLTEKKYFKLNFLVGSDHY